MLRVLCIEKSLAISLVVFTHSASASGIGLHVEWRRAVETIVALREETLHFWRELSYAALFQSSCCHGSDGGHEILKLDCRDRDETLLPFET